MIDDQSHFHHKVALALVFVAVLATFFLFGGERWLSLEFIKENRERLLIFTNQHYGLMLIGAALTYIASTAFSLPGGTVLSLAMGFLFGRWLGTVLTVFAATIGATLAFWAARFIFADSARTKLLQNPSATKIIEGFQKDAFQYLLFLRLVLLFPFWLVNLAPSVTTISTRIYVLATLIGVIPGSFVYVNLGQTLSEIGSIQELFSPGVVLSLSLLGLLALLPVLLRKNHLEA